MWWRALCVPVLLGDMLTGTVASGTVSQGEVVLGEGPMLTWAMIGNPGEE